MLEIIQDIHKFVVDLWAFPKPILDEIQVGESVGDIGELGCAVWYRLIRRGLRRHGQLRVLVTAFESYGLAKSRIGCFQGTLSIGGGPIKVA